MKSNTALIQQMRLAGLAVSAIAGQMGVSRQYVHDVLRGQMQSKLTPLAKRAQTLRKNGLKMREIAEKLDISIPYVQRLLRPVAKKKRAVKTS